jgi:hypothetical protein
MSGVRTERQFWAGVSAEQRVSYRRLVRMATFDEDHWQLRSGEASNAASPQTFSIPSALERSGLTRGKAAKLIFEIEVEHADGSLIVEAERMWVVVRDVLPDGFLGILDNKPASFDPADDVYLRFGCEVPFAAEHVIDIADPPQEYVDWQLGQEPEQTWS